MTRTRYRLSDPSEHDEVMEDAQVDDRLRPLEERLRSLEWPAPPPGLRERSLKEFRRKIAENGGGAPDPEADH